nr:mannan endo-1,4-beta-mannosidase 7 [Quercus suber]
MKQLSVAFFVLLLIQNYGILLHAGPNDGFVTTKGVQLLLNGKPYHARGFNGYWMMSVAFDPSQRDKVSTAFQDATKHGLTIARTWAFSDGGVRPLQSSLGSYNEQMFQGLDFVISEAKKYGIKIVLSLVNNYADFGGKKQYAYWALGKSLTRIAYKDDPAIMAWELMNEPRCPSDISGKTIQAWIAEIAPYLKSIDGKHLLEVGLERLLGSSDESQLSFLDSWLNDHIQDAQNILHKPVLIAEFGKSLKLSGIAQRDQLFNTVYSTIYLNARGGGTAVGGLFWQLLAAGMDSFRNVYEVILSKNSSTAILIAQES